MIPAHGITAVGCAGSLVLALVATPARAYNSEEHKVIGDWAASEVLLDPSIQLPYPTRFDTFPVASYLAEYTAAKNLAVGFATNSQAQFDGNKKRVQDNSYPPGAGFAQLAGNKNLWIPDSSLLHEYGLFVLGLAESVGRTFTFGDLMALYGDYRRTNYCDVEGCYLTDGATSQVSFGQGFDCYLLGVGVVDGLPGADCGWRPAPLSSTAYLRAIAAGLWPPYHSLGNLLDNTAKTESDYFEAGWWGDEMIRIADTNDWHFSDAAVAWYIGLHRLALLYVEAARTDPRAWNAALHYEANALHSLSDLFAFGHVVTSRDETSFGIMSDRGLTGLVQYAWMQHALAEGGGHRSSSGRVSLTANLPPIQDAGRVRQDFLPSYLLGTGYAAWANTEHNYHDQFNGSGAVVRNLRGDSLQILGDARLRATSAGAREIIKEAVRASLQSLFDAYVKLDRYGDTVEHIGAPGSDYFAALRYIPVFVQSDPGHYFTGRWTRYASAIDVITGANVVPAAASACAMPYLNGGENLPAASASACATFPAVANQPPAAPELLGPSEGATGVGQPTVFRWSPSPDPEGDAVSYDLVVCDDPGLPARCGASLVIPPAGVQTAGVSGIGLLLLGAVIGAVSGRRRPRLILALVAVVSAPVLGSCGGGGGGGGGSPVGATDVTFTRSDLQPATTYYWEVIARDANGGSARSAVDTFSTR